jgi:hypothetical protein
MKRETLSKQTLLNSDLIFSHRLTMVTLLVCFLFYGCAEEQEVITLDTTSEISFDRSLTRMLDQLPQGEQRLVQNSLDTMLDTSLKSLIATFEYPTYDETLSKLHGLDSKGILDFQLDYEIDIAQRSVASLKLLISEGESNKLKRDKIIRALDKGIQVEILKRYVTDGVLGPGGPMTRGTIEAKLTNTTEYQIVETGLEVFFVDPDSKKRYSWSVNLPDNKYGKNLPKIAPKGTLLIKGTTSLSRGRYGKNVSRFENSELEWLLYDVKSSDTPSNYGNPRYPGKLEVETLRLAKLLTTRENAEGR